MSIYIASTVPFDNDQIEVFELVKSDIKQRDADMIKILARNRIVTMHHNSAL
jgi:hypothetical protein